jgi:hypothetical protein
MIDAKALKPGDEVAIYIDGGITGWYQIAEFEGVTPSGDLMVGGEAFSPGGFRAGRGWAATLHAPTPEIRELHRRSLEPLPVGRRPRAERERPIPMAWTAVGNHEMAGAESWLSLSQGRYIYRGVKVEDATGIFAVHPGIRRGIRDWIDDPSPKLDRITIAIRPGPGGPDGSPRGIRFIMRAGRPASEVASSRRISRFAGPDGVTARAARRVMEYLQEDLVLRIRARMGSFIAPDPQAEEG